MRKIITLLFILVSLSASSKEIYEKTARKVAKMFYLQKTGDSTGCEFLKRDSSFFYYNFPNGFVIVRKYDQLKPIQGYSTESRFNEADLGMQEFLSVASERVQRSSRMQIPRAATWDALEQGKPQLVKAMTPIPPMVPYLYDQDTYYWDSLKSCKYHNLRTYTGCVATVGVTICRYWQYPSTGVGKYSYTDQITGEQSANFENKIYRWDLMPTTIKAPNPYIAQAMKDMGISVAMQYGCIYEAGSGAYPDGMNYPSLQKALVQNWKYKSTMKSVYQSKTPTFDAILRAELLAGRPVPIWGGAHIFIGDGMDENGLVHLRFGWHGLGDSYMSTTNIQVMGNDFRSGLAMMTGVEPAEPVTPPTPPTPIPPTPVPPTPPIVTCPIPTGLMQVSSTTTQVKVKWNKVQGATSYTVRLENAAAPVAGLVRAQQFGVSDTFYTINGTPNSYWNVQVGSRCGSPSSGFGSAIKVGTQGTTPPPTPPVIIQCDSNRMTFSVTSKTITIGIVSTPTDSLYQISYKPTNSTTYINTPQFTQPTALLSALLDGVTYDIRLSKTCKGGAVKVSVGRVKTNACQ